MLHIENLEDGLELFKSLGSDVRIEIIRQLLQHPGMNMNELAGRLKITNGALTSHIKKLESCGIVQTSSEAASHGNQKICTVHVDKILIDLMPGTPMDDFYQSSIKVGHYSNHEVYPTCGLASAEAMVGEVDDPRYFSHPDRYNADILWFTRGFVEYDVPNFIPPNQQITELMIEMEISSEAPGVNNNWPSDIRFYLNGQNVGEWTSPGDFGDVQGIFTPDWWYPNWNQYGLLKLLVVNRNGTFIDGRQISEVTTTDLALTSNSQIKFRLAVEEDAAHVGGLTIFGKTFGNYAQDIAVRIGYMPL
ncbi:MAG: winged helix-turn-helix transcriptional regulator [Lachnospiraceae bacterium]|nr:winged helix-turn-helix transcriptional regulator [Lachnospiraceae bacterium]